MHQTVPDFSLIHVTGYPDRSFGRHIVFLFTLPWWIWSNAFI